MTTISPHPESSAVPSTGAVVCVPLAGYSFAFAGGADTVRQ